MLVQRTIREVCDRLVALLHGEAGVLPIDASPEILYTSPNNFVIADEKGDPNSRLVLASKGYTNLISLICERPNGRYTSSVIRGCPYDEDAFPIPKLIEAFQRAEDVPDVSIWGGSNLAAGSDSELGSSLHWTRLRDIAEPIVTAACAGNQIVPPLRGEEASEAEFRVVLAIHPDSRVPAEVCLQQCGVVVTFCESCAEVLDTLSQTTRVNAVFCAPRLPDGSFRDLRRELHKRCGFIPIVICAQNLDGGWIDLLEAGAFAVLSEPYDSGHVRKLLASMEHLCRTPGIAGA
jgi:CheY-like chemotaxis protein